MWSFVLEALWSAVLQLLIQHFYLDTVNEQLNAAARGSLGFAAALAEASAGFDTAC